jgi:hypothetical protein
MAKLVSAIHVFAACSAVKMRMAATSAGMMGRSLVRFERNVLLISGVLMIRPVGASAGLLAGLLVYSTAGAEDLGRTGSLGKETSKKRQGSR